MRGPFGCSPPVAPTGVWQDTHNLALTNYLTGLGFATGDDANYLRWWAGDGDRIHVVGKGIVRFHAVYWIAFLLSAGLPLPTRVLVHDYLTVDGAKIAKSGAHAADAAQLAAEKGADAVRWWLLREPAPVGTTDFTLERLVSPLQPRPRQHAREPRLPRPNPVPPRRNLAHRT
jgi:methionyl-tRNA synthetase